jgi:hypothetical protein
MPPSSYRPGILRNCAIFGRTGSTFPNHAIDAGSASEYRGKHYALTPYCNNREMEQQIPHSHLAPDLAPPPNHQNQPSAKPVRIAWRPRLSLLTALLLMTIIGLAIGLIQLWREVGPLRAEVRQLRDEVGRLSIDDPTKLHAIEVRSVDDHTWKWRVWVPEGKTVQVHSQWGNVPRNGVPPSHNSVAINSGEYWITLSARHNKESGQWEETLATQGGSVGGIIQPNEHWFDWKSTASTGEGVSHTTYVAPDKDATVVLKRFRAGQVNSSALLNKSNQPTPGFIVWIERN